MSKPGPKPQHAGARQPAATPVDLRPPRTLLGRERAAWVLLARAILRAGTATLADRMALLDAATCLARLRECEADIRARGSLVTGQRGGQVRNPSCQLAREYRQALRKWLVEFGLTPLARQHIKLPDRPPDEDPFQAYMRQVQAVAAAGAPAASSPASEEPDGG